MLRLLEPLFNFIVSLLRKYQAKTGLLPINYWHAIIKMTPVAAIELIVLRGAGADQEILLLRRSSTDPIWPNQLHFPGTVIRNGDSLEKALDRDAKEIGLDQFSCPPQFFGFDICPSERNYVVSLCYVLEAGDFTPIIGEFHSLNALPSDMMQYQIGQLTRLGILTK